MKNILAILLFLLNLDLYGQKESLALLDSLNDQGKEKEAISLASDVLSKINSDNQYYAQILRRRAYYYMKATDFNSAIVDFNLLTKMDSSTVNDYMAVSYAYWSKGDNENSTKAIEEAYKISPDDPGVLSNLAYNYCELKKFDDALRLTIVGLKKTDLGNDWKANLLRNQGFAYLGLEQYEMAILSLNKSIELNPSNSFAYYFRALSNIGLNKTDSVCNDLKKSYENGGINLTSDLIKIYCKK